MNSTEINSKKITISPEIAEICGIHAGDGYLRNDGQRREWDISGAIEEREYYDRHVIPLFNKVFKLHIKGRFFPSRYTYGFVIRDRKTIEFAHDMLGFPYGNKTLKVEVPSFILKDISLMTYFLRGYFDTDGHLGFAKRYGLYSEFKRTRHCYPRLMFTTVSYPLSRHLQNMFKIMEFNFVSYTYRPKKRSENLKYRFDINGVNNLRRWLDLIGIKNPTKYSRFLVWAKYGFCPVGTTCIQRRNILKGELLPSVFYGPIV
tara:strand:+ start:262 stop:1041 length:780 start_codon:yes stop_codon:yes gene_type:complete